MYVLCMILFSKNSHKHKWFETIYVGMYDFLGKNFFIKAKSQPVGSIENFPKTRTFPLICKEKS